MANTDVNADWQCNIYKVNCIEKIYFTSNMQDPAYIKLYKTNYL